MLNNMEIELYDDLRVVCDYARNELYEAYNYFKDISDNNGICILFCEINDFDNLYRGLDVCDPRREPDLIYVPNIYEWGFFHGGFFEEARTRADHAVIDAIEQRKVKSSNKLYISHGSFYGYYCYNIYNKCLGWVKYSLQKFPIKTSFSKLIVDYFESAMQYFMRFEDK